MECGKKTLFKTLCLTGLSALLGCGKVEENKILPWFMARTTVHTGGPLKQVVNNFGGPSSEVEYFVKSHGFWRKLDRCYGPGAKALDRETVAVPGGDGNHYGMLLIHEGETVPKPACGSLASAWTMPPGGGLIDCVDAISGPARAVPTQIRFRRISASGQTLNDKTISVDAPGRVFLRPMVEFYDELDTAYFITVIENERRSADPDCAIVAVGAGDPRFIAGPRGVSMRNCSESSTWAKVLGRPLQDSTPYKGKNILEGNARSG
jgi:hypothetical protein